MIFDEFWRYLEGHVFLWPSSATLFNPYRDVHPAADRKSAPRIRRDNLRAYLDSFPAPPPVLVIGEASGPWGCRFSGVPFTSERQLAEGALPFAGRASSRAATPHAERTATVFWEVMAGRHPRFFVWNSVPLHPHPAGEPFALCRPRPAEVRAFQEGVALLVATLAPRRILAVGRIAEGAVREAGFVATYVRHPSHGGAALFRTGIARAIP